MSNIHYIGSILFLLLISSCFGGEPEIGDTLTGERVMVIGHGGSGFGTIDSNYPSNTEKSILQAIDLLGADGVEIDVQLTADSVLLLYHDGRLESQTSCIGCLLDHSSEFLTGCGYPANVAPNFSKEKPIWPLEALFENFSQRANPPWIFIDLSVPTQCLFPVDANEYFRTFAVQLSRLIKKYGLEDRIVVELPLLEQLVFLHELHPGLHLAWLGKVDIERLEMMAQKGFWGVVTPNDDIDKAMVEEAHRRGLYVILYNVKVRGGTLQAVAKGPDFIETDNIPLLHSVLEP